MNNLIFGGISYMYEFDNRSDCLELDYDFNITEDDYKKLKLFIEENFSEIGHFYDSPLSGYYNYSINFNIGDEYCCLTIYNNCLFTIILHFQHQFKT